MELLQDVMETTPYQKWLGMGLFQVLLGWVIDASGIFFCPAKGVTQLRNNVSRILHERCFVDKEGDNASRNELSVSFNSGVLTVPHTVL